MNREMPDWSTDLAWEEWGRRDPYFGVLTDPKFRRADMNEQARREFFETGRRHVDYVIQTVHRHLDPDFVPHTVLDFGCGVGRLLVPFAKIAHQVVGMDVAPSMLREAKRNAEDHGLTNVRLLPSDDALSSLSGSFDLIHSCLVFQHIPRDRGSELLRGLLRHLAPGGTGVFHFLYSKVSYSAANGVSPVTTRRPTITPTPLPPGIDPEIQMNPYNTNEILFALQQRGISQCHVEFTNHGGELGMFVFFQLDPQEPTDSRDA